MCLQWGCQDARCAEDAAVIGIEIESCVLLMLGVATRLLRLMSELLCS